MHLLKIQFYDLIQDLSMKEFADMWNRHIILFSMFSTNVNNIIHLTRMLFKKTSKGRDIKLRVKSLQDTKYQ